MNILKIQTQNHNMSYFLQNGTFAILETQLAGINRYIELSDSVVLLYSLQQGS